jgi:divalent metal cation (Fe/Co/Zn/Cd) transporter
LPWIGVFPDEYHDRSYLPLWVAFALVRWRPSRRFTYGYGRMEDLAGVVIVLTILSSAVAAGYESL